MLENIRNSHWVLIRRSRRTSFVAGDRPPPSPTQRRQTVHVAFVTSRVHTEQSFWKHPTEHSIYGLLDVLGIENPLHLRSFGYWDIPATSTASNVWKCVLSMMAIAKGNTASSINFCIIVILNNTLSKYPTPPNAAWDQCVCSQTICMYVRSFSVGPFH